MPPGTRRANTGVIRYAVTRTTGRCRAAHPAPAYDDGVTHEYVIGLRGRILFAADADASGAPSAIAWAADRVLAVGSDPVVRAISRGDSVFLDLAGCVVTPLPHERAPAGRVSVRLPVGTAGEPEALETCLVEAGLVRADATLEPGSPADLAFWWPAPPNPAGPPRLRLAATVRGGAFTAGEPHHGPFADAPVLSPPEPRPARAR